MLAEAGRPRRQHQRRTFPKWIDARNHLVPRFVLDRESLIGPCSCLDSLQLSRFLSPFRILNSNLSACNSLLILEMD